MGTGKHQHPKPEHSPSTLPDRKHTIRSWKFAPHFYLLHSHFCQNKDRSLIQGQKGDMVPSSVYLNRPILHTI